MDHLVYVNAQSQGLKGHLEANGWIYDRLKKESPWPAWFLWVASRVPFQKNKVLEYLEWPNY